MKRSTIYLLFCMLGIVAPFLVMSGFFRDENASIPYFFTSIFANPVASAVATDLMLSALVFFVFAFFEGRRTGMKSLWLYIPATLFIGLCFGLPLFLYNRERAMEKGAQ